MLESLMYGQNAFATLTYSEDRLRFASTGLATLWPKDLQNWLKRLRAEIAPVRIRFYAVGEYGDETWRPHYHAALFGLPSCRRGVTGFGRIGESAHWSRCCDMCRLVGETWQHGNVFLGNLELHSAQYVAGYVTKKMTRRNDDRLVGRHPEFARMSNRPGIGSDALWEIASELMRYEPLDDRISQGDVPVALRHGGKQLPLGRYLRKKLRVLIGREGLAPDVAIQKIEEELYPLRLAARSSAEAPSLARQMAIANAGAVANFEARQKLQRKGKMI